MAKKRQPETWRDLNVVSSPRQIRLRSLVRRFALSLIRCESGKPHPLPPGRVEVFGIEPALERLPARRPLAVEHREPSRVAVIAFDDHVLPEHALRREAEALRGALRGLVAVVALPLEAAV